MSRRKRQHQDPRPWEHYQIETLGPDDDEDEGDIEQELARDQREYERWAVERRGQQ